MRSLPRLAAFCFVAAVVAGCDWLPPAPSPVASAPSSSQGRVRRDAGVPPDLAPPPLVAVSVAGRVTAPGAPAGRLVVVVTDGPCFRVGTHYLAFAQVAPDGTFTAELFPPWGTRLEVCAALVPTLAQGGDGVRRATAWWGRAVQGPWTASGPSGMRLGGLDVTVRFGDEATLPTGGGF